VPLPPSHRHSHTQPLPLPPKWPQDPTCIAGFRSQTLAASRVLVGDPHNLGVAGGPAAHRFVIRERRITAGIPVFFIKKTMKKVVKTMKKVENLMEKGTKTWGKNEKLMGKLKNIAEKWWEMMGNDFM
jgi:hypothetical protein